MNENNVISFNDLSMYTSITNVEDNNNCYSLLQRLSYSFIFLFIGFKISMVVQCLHFMSIVGLKGSRIEPSRSKMEEENEKK